MESGRENDLELERWIVGTLLMGAIIGFAAFSHYVLEVDVSLDPKGEREREDTVYQMMYDPPSPDYTSKGFAQ